jgi:hypothetical protein
VPKSKKLISERKQKLWFKIKKAPPKVGEAQTIS